MARALCISLMHEGKRRRVFSDAVPAFLSWSFLDASNGHRPETINRRFHHLLPKRFWGGDKIKPGAFGCFVSHYRAWMACLEFGENLIVLEDDVEFNPDAEAVLHKLASSSHDVLFANRRAVNWHEFYGQLTTYPPEDERSLREVLLTINESNKYPPFPGAIGGDCYLVTPTAAEKLIMLADRFGAVAGVDWFIAAIGLTGIHFPGRWQMPARVLKLLPLEDSLNIGVAGNWLAGWSGRMGSTIHHEVQVPIKAYADRMTSNARKP